MYFKYEIIANETLNTYRFIDNISHNPNISLEFIKNNLDNDWCWNSITMRVTYEEFIENPNLPWRYSILTCLKFITFDYIKNNLDNDWDWYEISERVTYEEFIENPNLPWNYSSLSSNLNIPFEYIKTNLDKSWEWAFVSSRVTHDEFINNLDLPWHYTGLSYNSNISLEDIKKLSTFNLYISSIDWRRFSRYVTYEEFINNLNLPWNYKWLSKNLNIPIEYIKNNLNNNSNKKWCWDSITQRFTLGLFEFVR